MPFLTRFMLPITLLLMSLGLLACGGTDVASQSQATNTADNIVANVAPTTDPANAGLVARVNGEPITEEAFNAALARRAADSTVTDSNALAAQILESLIEQALINQAAAELNISVSDEEIQREVEALKASVADDEAWQEFLALNNFTEEEFTLAQRESLLTQRLRDQLLSDLLGDVAQVRARHILVATEAEANAVLARLGNGESFVDLANDVSMDTTTRDNGGELGWFTADELMDSRLADVAFNLEPNQVAGPVATRLGYHIIQTLEKANRPIETERMPMLMESVFVNWLSMQLADATIERYR